MHAATYEAFFDELSAIQLEKDAGLREALRAVPSGINKASLKGYLKADALLNRISGGRIGAKEVVEGIPKVMPTRIFPG
jgi:hypothetical protein